MTPRKRRTVLAVPAGCDLEDLLAVLADARRSWHRPVIEIEPAFGDRPAHILVTSSGRLADATLEEDDLPAAPGPSLHEQFANLARVPAAPEDEQMATGG